MSTGERTRIVIVGAGQTGARAALALRSLGHEGPITLIGAENHLPYERPQLSKDLLLKPGATPNFIKTAEEWAEQDVDLWLGSKVEAIDAVKREISLANDRTAKFDCLLLATGTVPRRCAPLDGSTVPVRYLRTLEDSHAIKEGFHTGARIIIIGGGIIGLEVAAGAIENGCSVTVIEAADRLFGRALPEVVSSFLLTKHTNEGVSFRLETTVSEVDGDTVILSDGTRLPADLIVVGIGVEPPADLANALGLPVSESFKVDATTQTSVPGIHAAGDAAVQYSPWHDAWVRVETWANAQNQAMAAAKAMMGQEVNFVEPAWFWSDQYDLNIQVVGNALGDEHIVRGNISEGKFTLISLRNGKIIGGITVNNPREMGALRKFTAARSKIPRTVLEDTELDLRKAIAA